MIIKLIKIKTILKQVYPKMKNRIFLECWNASIFYYHKELWNRNFKVYNFKHWWVCF